VKAFPLGNLFHQESNLKAHKGSQDSEDRACGNKPYLPVPGVEIFEQKDLFEFQVHEQGHSCAEACPKKTDTPQSKQSTLDNHDPAPSME